ncbi:ATP-binding protein [Amycolatopsis sp. PS_44_ISF1]|uniref:sensor histidine kinase n=1 Tax=Amycolatopsis sp. PS_44_ISF1 TaxID=2974917 RepID=UPI0028DD590A|nr:ATP-binding protein [Amycolatopsis sp. PS_44_ISF1]MDT8911654.1 histidine kinase [Amycolatopsis sp. PS_44_ISF1]
MRAREKRAIHRVADYLAEAGAAPHPAILAELIGTGLGAAGCELSIGTERHRWGRDAGSWWQRPVAHGGERHGALAVSPASLGPLPRLVAVLGAPLALVDLVTAVDRARRAADAAAGELIDERWRAIVELEQERRALERDLHDGAQHQLVALRLALALAGATDDPAWRVALLDRVDTAHRVIRDTAAGILPLALAADGLAAGLAAEFSGLDDVVLHLADLRRRYSPAVESTVYFTCLEAVNNAHKHAPGARIGVTVRDTGSGVEFVVTDTGAGFTDRSPHSGLHNLAARASAVGGVVTVRSAPGRGTTVTGLLPG